jgi:hypothetical protein
MVSLRNGLKLRYDGIALEMTLLLWVTDRPGSRSG